MHIYIYMYNHMPHTYTRTLFRKETIEKSKRGYLFRGATSKQERFPRKVKTKYTNEDTIGDTTTTTTLPSLYIPDGLSTN